MLVLAAVDCHAQVLHVEHNSSNDLLGVLREHVQLEGLSAVKLAPEKGDEAWSGEVALEFLDGVERTPGEHFAEGFVELGARFQSQDQRLSEHQVARKERVLVRFRLL